MIRLLSKQEAIPYQLLLLADETKEAINQYIYDSEIYVFEIKNIIIAVYALYEIDLKTVEIKNIAVKETELYLYQKNGFEIHDIKKNFFIDNYPNPIYENGILLNHMIMLRKIL